MKKILSVILSVVCLSTIFAVPVFADERVPREWESVYASAIKKNGNDDYFIASYQLTDFDLDGTPELLIGYATGNSRLSQISKLFTYRDSDNNGTKELVELPTEDYLPLGGKDYILYQNNLTKDFLIENEYYLRAGIGNYAETDLANYVLEDKLYTTEIFAKLTRDNIPEYYIYNYYHDPMQPSLWSSEYMVSESKYNSSLQNYHYNWLKIDSYKSVSVYSPDSMSSSEINAFLASYEDGPALAVRSTHNVTLNNEEILPDKPSGYNIAGRNFYRLRDIAATLADTPAKFSVNYDAATQTIILETEKDYTSERWDLDGAMNVTKNLLGIPSKDKILIDGKAVSLKAYKIDNENYFELRDLGAHLGFGVDWDAETETVLMSTLKWQYPMKGSLHFSQTFIGDNHLGLDMTSNTDETVYAAADGIVVAVGVNGTGNDASTYAYCKCNVPSGVSEYANGNGYYIVIEHQLGDKTVYSLYAHLQPGSIKVTATVDKNNPIEVKAGQPIAIYGNTGHSHGRHLHFAIADSMRNGSYSGYTTDASINKGNIYKDKYGVTFYNPHYVIENQKLPEE